MRATTLEKGSAKVFTVEHLLSALYGMEIDNCFVEMDSVEPPVADGSSLTFVKLIEEAGVHELDVPRRPLVIQNSISSRTEISSSPSYRMTASASPLPRSIHTPCWACSF